MNAVELTVPCVAAHLLAAGVLRFLPTDATAECETCGGRGYDRTKAGATSAAGCPHCRLGRRPFRAGDRIAIRADDNVPNAPASLDPWCLTVWRDLFGFRRYSLFKRLSLTDIPLRPGEVVGYATVTNVLPIVGGIPPQDSWREPWRIITTEPWPVVASWPGYGSAHPEVALVDHVDAGLVFTPGQIALEMQGENE